MANRYEHLELELRRRVSRLFDDTAKWKSSRASMLDQLKQRKETAFLFGGSVRDIMTRSPYFAFRDIDVVIKGATANHLHAEFAHHIARQTRFGGLRLDVHGWLFDVWPLEDTWAFRQYPLLFSPEPEVLPRTTFMTIEAVVVALSGKRGRPRDVFECGFFEAIATKTVEINFEHTPFPYLNIVRSILTARRLGFSIGPRLARFIVGHLSCLDIAELLDIQKSHYGHICMTEGELSKFLDKVTAWHRWHPSEPMPIPRMKQKLFAWCAIDVE